MTQSSGRGTGMEEDALLVESDRVSRLPGLWVKKVTVGDDQFGFLMSRGAVVRELGSGTARVGTVLKGGSREVLRFRFRSFSMRLDFGGPQAASQGSRPLAIEVTASITAPSLLYASALNGPGRLYSSQLAAIVAGAVEGLAREKLAGDAGGSMDELEMLIRRAMAERGLEAQRMEIVS